jgi:selenoprotein W-related protein
MSGATSKVLAVAVAGAALALQQVARRRQLKAREQLEATKAAKAQAQDADADGEWFVVEIEYCTGCRWLLRAAWMAQELLTTFQTDASSRLRSVKLTPNARQGGVFQVYAHTAGGETELLWSRKAAGRFPESKELKQLVRDVVCPDRSLGHSDKK